MSFPDYAGLTAKVDNVDTIMAADINELQDAIQEIAVRGYGTFPMAEGVWYSPTTAIGGYPYGSSSNERLTADDTAFAAPIQIYEACTISKVGIFEVSVPAGATTILFALHEPSTSGFVGVKVGDLGEIVIDETYDQSLVEDTCSVAVTPGWYWAVISADAEISLPLLGGGTDPAFSGPVPQDIYGDGGAFLGIGITSTGIEDAIPSDLSSATQSANRYAPRILFQIDHP